MSPIVETVTKIIGMALIAIVVINMLVILLKKKLNIKEKIPVLHVKLVDEEKSASEAKQEKIDYKDSYEAKERLLSKPENLFRNILKTGLPGHEIFANVRLADIVKVQRKHRGNKNTWLFRNIAQYHIDFLVCDKETNIIAAFELDDPSHDTEDGERRDAKKNECLNAVGIKLIRIRVENMPKHTDIKNMVYGTQ